MKSTGTKLQQPRSKQCNVLSRKAAPLHYFSYHIFFAGNPNIPKEAFVSKFKILDFKARY